MYQLGLWNRGTGLVFQFGPWTKLEHYPRPPVPKAKLVHQPRPCSNPVPVPTPSLFQPRPPVPLVFNAFALGDAGVEGVLDVFHFGDVVGGCVYCGAGFAAG